VGELTLFERLTSEVKLMLWRPPRQQYAALCYRRRKPSAALEILVMTSRDTGRWVIPKGWPMSGKAAHEVAAREAFEEAGVKGKADRASFGYYTYMKVLDGGLKVRCRVQVHLMEVKEQYKDFKEKGLRVQEWVRWEEACQRVNEPELKALIRQFARKMLDTPSAAC
jgi:8-oxo-dGTP pyrophosphatase MutT (NUDIX family)